MGLIASSIRALIPESKQAIAASIPTWDSGREVTPNNNYWRNAREGYMLDELVFDCIEFRATSAGEPPICGWRKTDSGEEKVTDHPVIALLNNPNPFMGRSQFWGALSMSLDIGGNAYVEKVRSAAGKVVELWPLRPDRMRVIPDSQSFIRGYRYTIGDHTFMLPAADVIRFKTRHPLDDYYGLPPLYVLAGRVDLDVWTRRFAEAFFRNAGVPQGMLNFVRVLQETDRQAIQRRWTESHGGDAGWHKVFVADGGAATYQPMGLGMGANGLAMAELNVINETRILGPFGISPSLIPSMAGAASSSYANRESDRTLFWEQTMIPWFRDADSALSADLMAEYPGLDRLEHDLSKVKALQEDEDKKHTRYREDFRAGVCTWEEARQAIGYPEEPDEPGMVLVPTTMVPTWSDEMLVEPEPLEEPDPTALSAPGAPGPNGAVPAVAGGQRNGAAH